MTEREQIMQFLLSSCDQKNQTILQLQAKIADLEKELAALKPAQTQS